MKFLLLTFLVCMPECFALSSSYSGSVELTAGQLISPDTKKFNYQTLGLEPQIQMQSEFDSNWRFHFDFWGQYNPANKSPSDVTQLELDEFSMSHYSKGRRLKLGYSYRNWEGTDLINPMDIFFSHNYINPLKTRSRSALGLFYDDSYQNFEWDFTYAYKQKEHLLPGSESQWWPRSLYLPTESDSVRLIINDDIRYDILDPDTLNKALDHNLALRVQYHGKNYDLALAGTEGLATPPLLSPLVDVNPIEIDPKTIYLLQSPIYITPVFYRQRAVAGKIVLTLGDFIFRLAAHHTQPLGDDSRIPSWSQLGVFAAERTFYFGQHMLTVLAQFIDSRRPETSGVSLLTSLYQKSYMGGLRWAPNENWTLFLALFQETTNWSLFSRSEVTWNFTETWSLGFEANIFQGPSDSALGTYDRNDSAYIHIKKSF